MPYGPVNPNSMATSPAIALGAVYGKCNVPLDATEPARFSLRPPSDEACLMDSATTDPARFSQATLGTSLPHGLRYNKRLVRGAIGGAGDVDQRGRASPYHVTGDVALAQEGVDRRDAQQTLASGPPEPLALEYRTEERDHRPARRRPRSVRRQGADAVTPAGEHRDGLDRGPRRRRGVRRTRSSRSGLDRDGHVSAPSRTSAALQPPKPSEVLRLTWGRVARGDPTTWSRSHAGSGSSRPSV